MPDHESPKPDYPGFEPRPICHGLATPRLKVR
mgnify:CR=1 FL=1